MTLGEVAEMCASVLLVVGTGVVVVVLISIGYMFIVGASKVGGGDD